MRRILIALLLALPALHAMAQERTITVASTTSTEQSGLFGHLLPKFTAATGIGVKVVALGTGQALDLGRRGDADVVFVHDRPAEEKFVAEGFAPKRIEVMYNDFVVAGPKDDQAKAAGGDVLEAFRRVAATKAPFISRGDRSGTRAAELRYWADAGVDIAAVRGAWYKEIGQGMGPALNAASASNAYVLTDRGTWLSFKNRGELAVSSKATGALQSERGHVVIPQKPRAGLGRAGSSSTGWYRRKGREQSPTTRSAAGDSLSERGRCHSLIGNDPHSGASAAARDLRETELAGDLIGRPPDGLGRTL